METKITTPVLLIAFNRPETTTVVFEYIRRAQPTKLYIALDGPRENKPYEHIVCAEVKNIVERVDWDCEVHYKINKENLGAEVTISEAIKWIFEKEEYAIIIEDDIVAPLSFFRFAQEMLIKYKNDNRIGTVTSNNFTPMSTQNNEDYFFAKYGHSWGWGTWKRVFGDFNLYTEVKEKHCQLSYLKGITNSKKEASYYQKKFMLLRENGIGNSTWDNIALYNHRINNSLSIIPRVNLSSNIGVYGLHAQGEDRYHYLSFDEKFKAVKHPKSVICNIDYDKHHFEEQTIKHKKNLIKRFSRILGSKLLDYGAKW